MSKSKFSLRQIIGDAFLIITGALTLGLMALPYLIMKTGVDLGFAQTSDTSLGSCYDLITNGQDLNSDALAASRVFLILVLVAACIVILLGLVDMIGSFMGKKVLNVTFISRLVSILLVAFAAAAFISIVVCVSESGIGDVSGFDIYQIGTGYIMVLVFSFVALLASFVAQTKKAKKK